MHMVNNFLKILISYIFACRQDIQVTDDEGI